MEDKRTAAENAFLEVKSPILYVLVIVAYVTKKGQVCELSAVRARESTIPLLRSGAPRDPLCKCRSPEAPTLKESPETTHERTGDGKRCGSDCGWEGNTFLPL